MNSFMRQSSVPIDTVHSFLKDKHAWENAIAMYQGPDPLDHWYNYICWYKNHLHGDPENKFRETLERCLTLYEHSDYYKQDARMVRLWLKYIEMQHNPLHFYQVLHQRGVGKQLAMFYIAWATYYESVNAHKETEAVFNLGFQEKAQPYAELHHAYSKVMYARQLSAAQATQQLRATQSMPKQPQQVQQVYYAQQTQQQQQQQIEQTHISRPTEQEQLYKAAAAQLQAQPTQQYYAAQPQQQIYQQNANYLEVQQRYTVHTTHTTQQEYTEQQQQHQHHQQQSSQQHAQPQQQEQQHHHHLAPTAEHLNARTASTGTADVTPNTAAVHRLDTMPIAATAESTEHTVETTTFSIRLPPKFATHSYNNNETWKPLLFLEEPDDPSRRCHYQKSIVYPPGAETEYSPEEIRARKYRSTPAQAKPNEQKLPQPAEYLEKPLQPAEEHYLQPLAQQQQPNKQLDAEQYEEEASSSEDTNSSNYSDNNDENESADYDEDKDEEYKNVKYEQSADDLEDQIEASTIMFTTNTVDQGVQNKTIKIKFKKERAHAGATVNYSAYTVESVYKAEISSPPAATAMSNMSARRNGHTFHPYMLGQTSTPKTATSHKRNKSKIKRINKFQIANDSNSNSFSTEHDAINDECQERMRNGMQTAAYNDNANYSFSSATALDNSNCSITSAVGRLNFRDTTNAYNNNASAAAEFSIYQENSYFATQHDEEAQKRRLAKAEETIERHLAKEAIDPFNSELCRAFLTKLNFPGTDDEHANYKIIQTLLPKITNTKTLTLPDGIHFSIDKEVGRGSYGSVYKATDANTATTVALKYQKPPNTWEIYICDQVLKRITDPCVLPGLMDISTAIIAPNASLIATEFSPFGSLLDINNKIRQATTKVMHESLVMHFSMQICSIVHELHKHKIIHADIKPDNFLLMRVPSTDLYYPSLRLIDFGCAIDMTLFPQPDETKFRKVIQTDGFTCIEMQEGRPWSYETDLFCIAGTVHVMLFGEYMQLQRRADSWDIKQKLPRYLKKHVWTKFFGEILNIQTGAPLPDLHEMKCLFHEEANKMDSELQKQIRSLSNILHRR